MGTGHLPAKDESVLETAVRKAHGLHQLVRFWDAPDQSNAWEQLMRLQVDYINTDSIQQLAFFLK